MKKPTILSCAAVGLLILNGGCIVVAKNKGPLALGACCKQAVAIDGDIYIIDVHTGNVSKIDRKSVTGAGAFAPTDSDHSEIVIVDD